MQLVAVDRRPSPSGSGHVRISAEVAFARQQPRTIWFDLPTGLEASVNDRGEPWLVMLLPAAICAEEDLVIDLPVDPTLLYNLKGLQRLWHSWYPWTRPVDIETQACPNPIRGTETGLFFSGGVDGYFSLLGADDGVDDAASADVTSLVMMWGFDIPLEAPDEFAQACAIGERTAAHFDKALIPIATNLRDLPGFQRWWGELTHGAALACVGHLLSNKFKTMLIGSTHDFGHLAPWGSHPLADPLYSSAHMAFVHHGGVATRVEKTARICEEPEAAATLRVCWRSRSASNCSQCSKCLRTMVTLDLLDKRRLGRSFDWIDYSLDRVANVYLMHQSDVDFALEIRDAAQERGRDDIVRAIDRSVARSKRLRPLKAAAMLLRSELRRVPLLPQVVRPIRRLMAPR